MEFAGSHKPPQSQGGDGIGGHRKEIRRARHFHRGAGAAEAWEEILRGRCHWSRHAALVVSRGENPAGGADRGCPANFHYLGPHVAAGFYQSDGSGELFLSRRTEFTGTAFAIVRRRRTGTNSRPLVEQYFPSDRDRGDAGDRADGLGRDFSGLACRLSVGLLGCAQHDTASLCVLRCARRAQFDPHYSRPRARSFVRRRGWIGGIRRHSSAGDSYGHGAGQAALRICGKYR